MPEHQDAQGSWAPACSHTHLSGTAGLSGPGKELPSEPSGSAAGATQTNTAAKTTEKRAF